MRFESRPRFPTKPSREKKSFAAPRNVRRYLKQIDCPYMREALDERFDNAISLIEPPALIFGGAIRDVLAGLPIGGDLDIITIGWESRTNAYGDTCRNFETNPKWIAQEDSFMALPKSYRRGSQRHWFEHWQEGRNIGHVSNFVGPFEAKAQVILYNDEHLEDAARSVDIVCCGVIMDLDGDVYEVIEGAYDDCRNRVLRVHEIDNILNHKVLRRRVTKLEERGFSSEIDIDSVRIAIKRREKTVAAKARRSAKRKATPRKAAPAVKKASVPWKKPTLPPIKTVGRHSFDLSREFCALTGLSVDQLVLRLGTILKDAGYYSAHVIKNPGSHTYPITVTSSNSSACAGARDKIQERYKMWLEKYKMWLEKSKRKVRYYTSTSTSTATSYSYFTSK